MKLKSFTIYKYSLPLKTSFAFGDSREGLLIVLKTDEGKTGLGDIAPLPTRSRETLADAITATKKFREEILSGNPTGFQLPPSVHFGIESALSQLQAPLDNQLDLQVTSCMFDALGELGSNTRVKLKLGSLPIDEAIKQTKARVKDKRSICIDANKSWSLKEAVEFCKAFSPEEIEYIEDPCKTFTETEKFFANTGFSLALDDYLLDHPIERILSVEGLKAVVVKPTLYGGASLIKKLHEKCKHLDVILSSSFESGVGHMHIAKLANDLGLDTPLGLGTYPYFKTDLLERGLAIQDGLLQISCSLYNRTPISQTRLIPVI